jgi:hypothetical protein
VIEAIWILKRLRSARVSSSRRTNSSFRNHQLEVENRKLQLNIARFELIEDIRKKWLLDDESD